MQNIFKYPFQKETYELIGIAMEIHRTLGKGFLEIVYKDAFEYELKVRGINYEREKKYSIKYKDAILPHCFYADFVIDSKVILEIKSKASIIEEHYAQVLNYLAISKLSVALIINFHEDSLQQRRVVL
jgi:GxxExxY protein